MEHQGPGPAAATSEPSDLQWFGHPRGLSTLFFTEMWERFSYYGMRALLILFMTAAVAQQNPGLGFDEATAGAVYGLYTSMVYLLTLPGGWIADKLWGQRRAVFVGGCIIALGHFTLAAPMVGDLYPEPDAGDDESRREEWGARRDAAFSLFYMGINIGAVLGPFVCSSLGEGLETPWFDLAGNWHLGFSAAGFGMILGLIQYRLGDRYLGRAGLFRTDDPPQVVSRRSRNFLLATGVAAAVVILIVWLLVSGALGLSLETFATWVGYGILLVSILFFAYLIFGTGLAAGLGVLFVALSAALPALRPGMTAVAGGQWAILVTLGVFILANVGLLAAKRGEGGVSVEKQRMMVIFWLFLLAAIFWSGFEQAGSSLNLFARDLTDRTLLGWEVPAGWLQNVNPFFIIVLAPVFGYLWTWLAHRNRNPSIPMKFALGLLGLSAGFFVIMWGASNASPESGASMAWLVATYFLFTCGELALSPVGLSSMTKLAPPGRLGQMMGVWFIATALGNLFAGLVAGRLETLPAQTLFFNVALFVGLAGLFALLLSPFVKRLTGGIR